MEQHRISNPPSVSSSSTCQTSFAVHSPPRIFPISELSNCKGRPEAMALTSIYSTVTACYQFHPSRDHSGYRFLNIRGFKVVKKKTGDERSEQLETNVSKFKMNPTLILHQWLTARYHDSTPHQATTSRSFLTGDLYRTNFDAG